MTFARFIEIWQRAETITDVMEAAEMTHARCTSLASRLRKRGIPLKKFPTTGRPEVNWDDLMALAQHVQEERRRKP